MDMIYGRSYDGSENVFSGAYEKPESCEDKIDVLFSLQNHWIYPYFVRGQEKFCNACEDAQVLEYEIR